MYRLPWYTLEVHRVFLLFALLLVAGRVEAAEAWAVVDGIHTPDASGRWRAVETSTRAAVLRGEARVPITDGMTLEEGDRVVTDEARVRVLLGRGEELAIREHSDVEVRERTALQRMGEVYYALRGAFTVQFGTVQTTVEGTEFVVSGEGGRVVVTVVEGRVRVVHPDGEVRLARWQGFGLDGPALREARSAVDRSFPAGAPRATIGVLGGGGAEGAAGAAGLRVFGRVRLAGPLHLAVDSGVATGGLRLPQTFGLDADIGGFGIGAQIAGTFEIDRLACDGAYAALHVGGLGTLRTDLPLSRRLSLQAVLRAGWVEAPTADVSVGVGVAL